MDTDRQEVHRICVLQLIKCGPTFALFSLFHHWIDLYQYFSISNNSLQSHRCIRIGYRERVRYVTSCCLSEVLYTDLFWHLLFRFDVLLSTYNKVSCRLREISQISELYTCRKNTEITQCFPGPRILSLLWHPSLHNYLYTVSVGVVYNLRICLNLSIWTSKQKFKLFGWKSNYPNYTLLIIYFNNLWFI